LQGFASVGPIVTEPFRGAPHTVHHIKRVALEAQAYYPLRLLAEDIVAAIGSKDALSEILAIYYWVLAHTRYANDPKTIELVRSPRLIVDRLRAGAKPSVDCDDLTALLCAMFLAMGREVRIVTVAFKNAFYNGQRQYQHVYLQVREPRSGQWIVLDPVAAESAGEMLRRVKAVKIWPVA
jgi:hypothetical protein